MSIPFHSSPLHAVLTGMALLTAGLLTVVPVNAQDVDEVQEGTVDVQQDGNETTIRASDGSIIRYSSFDVGSNETVLFRQPGKHARVLNRIRSGTTSHINGNLYANGQVYLTNPAGIVFGSGATVDVGRLYVAAGRISNENFRTGKDLFTDLSGTVKNLGQVQGTEVHFLGRRVANFGEVVAEDGVVTMHSGEDVLLGHIDESTYARIEEGGEETNADKAGVKNSGTVRAGDGKVKVGAGDMYSLAIESTGEVYAEKVEVDGGASGEVRASGTISATETESSEPGGEIDLLGEHLLLQNLDLDASGPAGGGTIRVGGGRHGEGDVRTASNVLINGDTNLSADATKTGVGGDVVVWSDEHTYMHGSASATGGSQNGDGGFVEISGKELDTDLSVVDVSAPSGSGGTVLFDPARIEIRGSAADPDGDDNDDLLDTDFVDNRSGGGQEITFSDGAVGDNGSGTGGEPFVVYENEIEGLENTLTNNDTTSIILEATDSILASTNGGTDDFQADLLETTPDLALPDGVDLTLRTRNDSTQGDTSGNIDLVSETPDGFTVITQGTGSITIQGATSADLESNLLMPRLESRQEISLYTGNGEIRLFGDINQVSSGASIVNLGNTILDGSEVEGGAIRLMSDISIRTGSGFSEFSTPIDSHGSPGNLDVIAGDQLELGGNIGNSLQLSSLEIFGEAPEAELTFTGLTIQTEGDQFYDVPVRVEGNSSVRTSSGGDAVFLRRIFSDQEDTGSPFDLSVDVQTGSGTEGVAAFFFSAIGVNPSGTDMPLSNVTVRSDEAIVMGVDTELASDTDRTEDSSIVLTEQDQLYDGNVGLGLNVNSLEGVDSYTQFMKSRQGNVEFNGRIEVDDDGQEGSSTAALDLQTPSGDTIFSSPVGTATLPNTDPDGLKFLRTDGDGVGGQLFIGSSEVRTVDVQGFHEPVQLSADVTFNSSNIFFRNTLDGDGNGSRALTVNTSNGGETDFEGSVGGTNPLGSITTNADGDTLLPAGSTVETTGDQTYGNPVETENSTVRSTEGNVEFQGFVDAEEDESSGASSFGLTVRTPSGDTTFAAEVGGGNITGSDPDGLAFLETDANSNSTNLFLPDTVTTTGDQIFREEILLETSTTLISSTGAGDIDLTDAAVNPQSGELVLTLDAGGGVAGIGDVGTSDTPIGDIVFPSSVSALELSGNIFQDAVFDNENDNLPEIRLVGDSTIDTSAGNGEIDLRALPVDADATGAHGISLRSGTGDIRLGSVGANERLKDIFVNSRGLLELNADVQTDDSVGDGNIDFSFASGGIQLVNDVRLDTGGGRADLESTINASSAGSQGLVVRAGDVVGLGAIGTGVPLEFLDVQGGSLTLSGDLATDNNAGTGMVVLVTTSSDTTLFNSVSIDTDAGASGDGGEIDLSGTDVQPFSAGSERVTVNAPQNAIRLGNVGSLDRMGGITITNGSDLFLGGEVVTEDGFDATGISNGVTLTGTGTTTVDTSSDEGTISFDGVPINATSTGGQGLRLDAGGNSITISNVGESTALSSLDVDTTGTFFVNAESIDTDGGAVDFVDATDVELGSTSVDIDSEAGDDDSAGDVVLASISKPGQIDATGGGELDIFADSDGGDGGEVQLGNIGQTDALSLLSVETLGSGNSGSVSLFGDITTDGSSGVFFSFEVAGINLGTDVTIDTSAGNEADMYAGGAPINGDQVLTIQAGDGRVNLTSLGSTTPLSALDIDSSNSTALLGNITTQGGGGVLLDDATDVNFGFDLTIDTSAGTAGPVDLTGGAVDGAVDLTINAGGGDVSLDATGQNTALSSINIRSDGVIGASGDISVNNGMVFSGDLRTPGDATVTLNGTETRVEERLEVGDLKTDDSVGALDVNADLVMTDTATYDVTLADTVNFDQVVVGNGGDVFLDGSTGPDLVGTAATEFSIGETFEVIRQMDTVDVNGSFSSSSVEIDGQGFNILVNEDVSPDANDAVLERTKLEFEWIGNGETNDWSDNLNWVGESAPSDEDVLVFNTDQADTGAPNNDFLSRVERIVFSADGSDSYALQGDSLTVLGDILNRSSVQQTINNDLSFSSGDHNIDAMEGHLVFNGTMNGPGALTLMNSPGSGTRIAFNGPAGTETPLSSVTVNPELSRFDVNAANVVTDGRQTYNAPVQIGADVALISYNGGTIDLTGSAVNATSAGEHLLEVDSATGTTELPSVGADTPLERISVNASEVELNGDLRTGNSAGGGTVTIDTSLSTTFLNSSITIDADAGDTGTGGLIDLTETPVQADSAGDRALTLDAPGGSIRLSELGTDERLGGIQFASSPTNLELTGSIRTDGMLDLSVATNPASVSDSIEVRAANLELGEVVSDSEGPYDLAFVADGSGGDLTFQSVLNTGTGGTVEFRSREGTIGNQVRTENLLLTGFTEGESNVDLTGPNDIDTLAVSSPTNPQVGEVLFRDQNGFSVGTVNPSGVNTTGRVDLRAGADSMLTIREGIASGGPVTLRSDAMVFEGFASIKAEGGGGVIDLAPGSGGDTGDAITVTDAPQGGEDVLEVTPTTLETRLFASEVRIGNQQAGSLSVESDVSLSGDNGYDLFLDSPQSMEIGASVGVGGHTLVARAGGDLTMNNSGTVLSATGTGKRVELRTSGSFVNNVGPGVFDVSDGARWLVYSEDPANNTPGGLLEVVDFEEFEVFAPEDPVGAGNGFYYQVEEQVEQVEENVTRDLSSSTTEEEEETTTERTAEERETETDTTTETAEETQTKVETDTLVDEYTDEEISESISEVEEPSGELTSIVDEPTQEAADKLSYEQRLQDDASQQYDASQSRVKQIEEQIENLEAQADQLEKQGQSEEAEEKREQAEELEQELEDAQEQLNQAEEQTDPSELMDEQLRQRMQQEASQVRQSLEDLNLEEYRNRNLAETADLSTDDPSEQPSNISAQQLRDKIVDRLQQEIQQEDGAAHPARAGTVEKLQGVDPIKGVGGSHIRSVSIGGTKAVPESDEETKSYYEQLSEDVKDWNKENTLRFQIMAGGEEDQWGFGLINIFLNRETGVYLMRSNLDILEGASEKIEGTNLESFVDEEQLESFEGDSTSLTMSGELQ